MTKKQKSIEINNIVFEYCGTTEGNKKFNSGAAYDEIKSVYSRPSQTKVEIWHDWCNWAYQFECELSICSHTCMFFSISGICNWSGKTYALYITYAHNRAYEII